MVATRHSNLERISQPQSFYRTTDNHLTVMSAKTDSLKDIFINVAGDETLTESQEEDPSREPMDERDQSVENQVITAAKDDGLEDAVDGIESN